MRLTGQRQVRHEVTVQIKLVRQTGPGNSLVRNDRGDGLIEDSRRASIGCSTGVLPVPCACIRLEADPLLGAMAHRRVVSGVSRQWSVVRCLSRIQ